MCKDISLDTVTSAISQIFCKSDLQLKMKHDNKEDKQYRKNQWKRLFSDRNSEFVGFLCKFNDTNNFRNIPESLKHYLHMDTTVFVDGVSFPLFQYKDENNQDKVHIAPAVYNTFVNELKKAKKSGIIQ